MTKSVFGQFYELTRNGLRHAISSSNIQKLQWQKSEKKLV